MVCAHSWRTGVEEVGGGGPLARNERLRAMAPARRPWLSPVTIIGNVIVARGARTFLIVFKPSREATIQPFFSGRLVGEMASQRDAAHEGRTSINVGVVAAHAVVETPVALNLHVPFGRRERRRAVRIIQVFFVRHLGPLARR